MIFDQLLVTLTMFVNCYYLQQRTHQCASIYSSSYYTWNQFLSMETVSIYSSTSKSFPVCYCSNSFHRQKLFSYIETFVWMETATMYIHITIQVCYYSNSFQTYMQQCYYKLVKCPDCIVSYHSYHMIEWDIISRIAFCSSVTA